MLGILTKQLAITAAVCGLTLMGTAWAQDHVPYGTDDDVRYGPGPSEEVVITAPRFHRAPSRLGAPIENVSLSQVVDYRDLDLRTPYGARQLRERVRFAANVMCRRLNIIYPPEAGNPPCYSNAVADAMPHVDAAIDEARDYPQDAYGGY